MFWRLEKDGREGIFFMRLSFVSLKMKLRKNTRIFSNKKGFRNQKSSILIIHFISFFSWDDTDVYKTLYVYGFDMDKAYKSLQEIIAWKNAKKLHILTDPMAELLVSSLLSTIFTLK